MSIEQMVNETMKGLIDSQYTKVMGKCNRVQRLERACDEFMDDQAEIVIDGLGFDVEIVEIGKSDGKMIIEVRKV